MGWGGVGWGHVTSLDNSMQENMTPSWCNSKMQTQERQRTRQKDIEEEATESAAAAAEEEEEKGAKNLQEEEGSQKIRN